MNKNGSLLQSISTFGIKEREAEASAQENVELLNALSQRSNLNFSGGEALSYSLPRSRRHLKAYKKTRARSKRLKRVIQSRKIV